MEKISCDVKYSMNFFLDFLNKMHRLSKLSIAKHEIFKDSIRMSKILMKISMKLKLLSVILSTIDLAIFDETSRTAQKFNMTS